MSLPIPFTMDNIMAINYKAKIIGLMETADLFFSLWNVPTRKPHLVCVSDDDSMSGNCWGKVVIEGKTWREAYEIMQAIALTPEMIAGRKLHEVPDNHAGKIVSIIDIEYDTDDALGDAPDTIPTKIIAVIPSSVKDMAEAENFLSDYISDTTGWAHFGFTIVPALSSLYRK